MSFFGGNNCGCHDEGGYGGGFGGCGCDACSIIWILLILNCLCGGQKRGYGDCQ